MKEEQLFQEVEKHVRSYLDSFVTLPCVEMIRKDPHCHLRVVSILARVRYLTQQVLHHGCDIDKEYLSRLSPSELERRIDILQRFIDSDEPDDAQEAHHYLMSDNSRKYLLAYVSRELNWVIVSIMSASYISALVLMRSVFELLIGIATRTEGSMGARVDGIAFLHEDERKEMLKLWNRLCGWSHPYGRWIKEVCPIFVAYDPSFHSQLCGHCLDELCCLVDFYAVTALSKYEVPIDPSCQPMQDPADTLSGLGMLAKRVVSKP
jgi:uncharacterized small protein (DUF1192 family)